MSVYFKTGTYLRRFLKYIEALAKPQVSPGAIGPFNPYGVDIVKRITPLASCFHPR